MVIGDLMHHALQCREPDWSTIFDWDRDQAARSRRRFLGEIAGTGTFVMPGHAIESMWFVLHVARHGRDRDLIERACEFMRWPGSPVCGVSFGPFFASTSA